MKLTAQMVPYSSIVGQSVSLHDETGKVIAIVTVLVPDKSLDYQSTVEPIIKQIQAAFPKGERLTQENKS